mmetsp:Transcript_131765/g.228311  ORF Transcript_131765/g.228311 Transcript_131765/m.228311 type:complete len:109 (+) Transcript_131765:41-367(+)
MRSRCSALSSSPSPRNREDRAGGKRFQALGWMGVLMTWCIYGFFLRCVWHAVQQYPSKPNDIVDEGEGETRQLIGEEWFYVLLVPLTVPVLMLTVYLNWLSFKFFRHN